MPPSFQDIKGGKPSSQEDVKTLFSVSINSSSRQERWSEKIEPYIFMTILSKAMAYIYKCVL